MSRLLGLIQNFQKLDYMDLDIVGSLNINDGVVSGFDFDNYLKLKNPLISTQSFEIQLKFNSNNLSVINGLFHSCIGLTNETRYGIGLNVENGKLNYCVSSNGTSWLFDLYYNNTLSENTDYWVKFGWNGTEYYCDLSTDGITYSRVITYLSTTAPTSNIQYTLIGRYNCWGINGTIDINNSNVEIETTKYFFRLPNLINLITVGSPTISGTVVNNFSDNNYLKIPNTNFSFNRNIDLYFKIHTDQINDGQSIFSSIQKPMGGTEFDCYIFLNAGNKYGFNSIRTDNHQLVQQAELNFNNDVDIYFHFSWNYNTKLFKFGYSYDGITYSYPISINDGYGYYKLISNIYIGKSINGYFGNLNAFAGSIDLDETKTYAIIDNKKYTFKLS